MTKNNIELADYSTKTVIDIKKWERSAHFDFFNKMQNNYGVTFKQDVTDIVRFRQKIKNEGSNFRFSDALYYLTTKAVNNIPELKMRIHNGKPVIYDKVHNGYTYIPKGKSLHSNCWSIQHDNFKDSVKSFQWAREKADITPTLSPAGDSDNVIYYSIIQGIDFTNINNPWGDTKIDTVPRILFGKITESSNGKKYIPVSIEVVHSFVDGKHLSLFAENLDTIFKNAEEHLS